MIDKLTNARNEVAALLADDAKYLANAPLGPEALRVVAQSLEMLSARVRALQTAAQVIEDTLSALPQ